MDIHFLSKPYKFNVTDIFYSKLNIVPECYVVHMFISNAPDSDQYDLLLIIIILIRVNHNVYVSFTSVCDLKVFVEFLFSKTLYIQQQKALIKMLNFNFS